MAAQTQPPQSAKSDSNISSAGRFVAGPLGPSQPTKEKLSDVQSSPGRRGCLSILKAEGKKPRVESSSSHPWLFCPVSSPSPGPPTS